MLPLRDDIPAAKLPFVTGGIGTISLGGANQDTGGVAWWAHVGGFLFGVVVCLGASRLPRRPRTFEQQHYQY